jgi:Lrp/AsnC family leucine-responsive transcriptional regulator
MDMKLDQTDLEILRTLQEHGRIRNSSLAEKANISPPSMLERVRKLEKSGVIKKYVAILEPKEIGIGVHTFVEVSLSVHGRNAVAGFTDAIGKMDEVMECHHITGEADFLLKIAVPDISAYEDLVLHKLTQLPHVGNLKTLVVLSTFKNNTAFSLKGVGNAGT